MKANTVISIAAICGLLAVALGAFGAHALKSMLEEHGKMDTYQTAVSYHFYHSLALLLIGVALLVKDSKWLIRSAYCMVLGILLFSGSLYVLCLTNLSILGIITPLGGLSFIAGWCFIFLFAKKSLHTH